MVDQRRPLRLADALRSVNAIDPNAPPAQMLMTDPAMGQMVEPQQMSPIGLDLTMNAQGAQEAYNNRGPQFDFWQMIHQLLSQPRAAGQPPVMHDPGPVPTFPPSYGRPQR